MWIGVKDKLICILDPWDFTARFKKIGAKHVGHVHCKYVSSGMKFWNSSSAVFSHKNILPKVRRVFGILYSQVKGTSFPELDTSF